MSYNKIKFFVVFPFALANIYQFSRPDLRVTILFDKVLINAGHQKSNFNLTNQKIGYTKIKNRSSSYYKGKRGSRKAFKLGPSLMIGLGAFIIAVLIITVLFIRILFG